MNPKHVFLILNGVRAFSIIALLLVFASSIFTLVTDIHAVNDFQHARQSGNDTSDALVNCDYIEGSTVPNQAAGVFLAVVNRLLIIFQVITLLLSELSWPMSFFDKFFPVLGSNFGVGALGIFQGLIGAAILSHHVDDFSLVSAFFLFAIGCINMFVGLIWREKVKAKRSIRAWRSGQRSVLPSNLEKGGYSGSRAGSPLMAPSTHTTGSGRHSPENSDESHWQQPQQITEKSPQMMAMGFGRQGEKAIAARGQLVTVPPASLPPYTRPQQRPRPPSVSVYSQESRPASEVPEMPPLPGGFHTNRF